MKVAVFGATGRTGLEIIKSCVTLGHSVVAAARRPEAVAAPPGVVTKAMSFEDEESLREAMRGCDVAVSAVGVAGLSGARNETRLYSTAARRLRSAMRAEGVPRIIVLSSGGVEEDPGAPWYYSNLLRPFVMNLYMDMLRMETILEESVPNIEFTSVRLTFLGNWDSKPFIVCDRTLGKGAFKISYKDAGLFVANEIEERKWINKFPVISYP